jgi:hypothetical protein
MLGHNHLRGRRVEKAPQATAGQPVGGENAMLEFDQRVEVGTLGFASADIG